LQVAAAVVPAALLLAFGSLGLQWLEKNKPSWLYRHCVAPAAAAAAVLPAAVAPAAGSLGLQQLGKDYPSWLYRHCPAPAVVDLCMWVL
jgi:hypothetical protein